jgi:hypothetical protein
MVPLLAVQLLVAAAGSMLDRPDLQVPPAKVCTGGVVFAECFGFNASDGTTALQVRAASTSRTPLQPGVDPAPNALPTFQCCTGCAGLLARAHDLGTERIGTAVGGATNLPALQQNRALRRGHARGGETRRVPREERLVIQRRV